LQNLAMTFLKGHRIRIDVSSSDYPQYDINPNTGGKLYAPDVPLVATNVVYHSTLYPSRLLLPVVTGGNASVNHIAINQMGARLEDVVPDPFSQRTTIRFHLSRPGYCRLDLFDLLGNRVATALHESLESGEHVIMLDGTGLQPGTYLCRLQAGESVGQRLVHLVR
jgi:hypothetical protein